MLQTDLEKIEKKFFGISDHRPPELQTSIPRTTTGSRTATPDIELSPNTIVTITAETANDMINKNNNKKTLSHVIETPETKKNNNDEIRNSSDFDHHYVD